MFEKRIPTEENGGVPVNLQDQTTRPLIVKFNEVQESTDLDIPGIKGAYTIKPTSTTGFINGRYIILFDPVSENFSFYTQIYSLISMQSLLLKAFFLDLSFLLILFLKAH